MKFAEKISILGTEYEIHRQSREQNQKLEKNVGLCERYSKRIIIGTFDEARNDKLCVERIDLLEKQILRHEIIHAFLGESGLMAESNWAENEEMIDWFAIQFEKLHKAFSEAGAL